MDSRREHYYNLFFGHLPSLILLVHWNPKWHRWRPTPQFQHRYSILVFLTVVTQKWMRLYTKIQASCKIPPILSRTTVTFQEFSMEFLCNLTYVYISIFMTSMRASITLWVSQSIRPSPSSCTAVTSYHYSPLTSSTPETRCKWVHKIMLKT